MLLNLRDRENETRQRWTALQKNINSRRNQIYEMLQAAEDLDKNVATVVEMIDKGG